MAGNWPCSLATLIACAPPPGLPADGGHVVLEPKPRQRAAHDGDVPERPARREGRGEAAGLGEMGKAGSNWLADFVSTCMHCCGCHSYRLPPPTSLQGMAWEGVLCEWYQVGAASAFLYRCGAALPAAPAQGTPRLPACCASPTLRCASTLQTRNQNWAYGFLSNLKGDFKWNGNQASRVPKPKRFLQPTSLVTAGLLPAATKLTGRSMQLPTCLPGCPVRLLCVYACSSPCLRISQDMPPQSP